MLGICYGAQLMAKHLGGAVKRPDKREFGEVDIVVDPTSVFFSGMRSEQTVWMSHSDLIAELPDGFKKTAHSAHCPVVAMENPERKLFGVQFHPEVTHTRHGDVMLNKFLFDVCEMKGDWQMASFLSDEIERIKNTVGDKKVLSAMSGGVDSSVSSRCV